MAKDGAITDKVFGEYYRKFQMEAIDLFVTQNSGKLGFKDSISILETDLRFAGDVLKRQNAEKYELEKTRKVTCNPLLTFFLYLAFPIPDDKQSILPI